MRRFFLTQQELNSGEFGGDEFSHMRKVLRMQEGDQFIAITGDQYDYICEIKKINKDTAEFQVLNKEVNVANPKINITIVQALCKSDKLELITQKATEIGATTLVPIYLKNCDVKQNTGKLSRLQKIAISASKQCKRSTILNIDDCITINELANRLKDFDMIIFANEREQERSIFDTISKVESPNNIAVIIGPEGGFTDEEIDKIINMGATSVSFGKRILRTETAGLYAISVLVDYYKV